VVQSCKHYFRTNLYDPQPIFHTLCTKHPWSAFCNSATRENIFGTVLDLKPRGSWVQEVIGTSMVIRKDSSPPVWWAYFNTSQSWTGPCRNAPTPARSRAVGLVIQITQEQRLYLLHFLHTMTSKYNYVLRCVKRPMSFLGLYSEEINWRIYGEKVNRNSRYVVQAYF
jgi:hypothetical protein